MTMAELKTKQIRDTSSLIQSGPRQGDIYTQGIIREVYRNCPQILSALTDLIGKGLAEIYELPRDIRTGLAMVSVESAAVMNNLNPSKTDLELMTMAALTGTYVESLDSDINYGLCAYFTQENDKESAIFYATRQIESDNSGARTKKEGISLLEQLTKGN